MNFQINGLPKADFAHLFDLSDMELNAQSATRVKVQEHPGVPCRVSLQDAKVGENVVLLNYRHQNTTGPFASAHAIFIREESEEANLDVNEIPEAFSSRVLSLRGFDKKDMMVYADLVDGKEAQKALQHALDDPNVSYAHIHFAAAGCFAASAHRAPAV